jgi:REP element-mobilizing transposase RayT
MPRSYTNLIYHIVFSTKDRRPTITANRELRLYEYIGDVIRGLGGILLCVNGVADHVHLLVKLRTVSESQVPRVSDYIARQKEHHQKESFEDEFVSMLKKNGIEVEMKYLWA